MPDGPRERFVPVAIAVPRPGIEPGFTPRNTSGLDGGELDALNRALDRLMAAGLDERDAKMALDGAVRVWLEPKDAGGADLDRLMKR